MTLNLNECRKPVWHFYVKNTLVTSLKFVRQYTNCSIVRTERNVLSLRNELQSYIIYNAAEHKYI
jgi:hypothetical protein